MTTEGRRENALISWVNCCDKWGKEQRHSPDYSFYSSNRTCIAVIAKEGGHYYNCYNKGSTAATTVEGVCIGVRMGMQRFKL